MRRMMKEFMKGMANQYGGGMDCDEGSDGSSDEEKKRRRLNNNLKRPAVVN